MIRALTCVSEAEWRRAPDRVAFSPSRFGAVDAPMPGAIPATASTFVLREDRRRVDAFLNLNAVQIPYLERVG